MIKIFILPKQSDLVELSLGDKNWDTNANDNFIILSPNKIIKKDDEGEEDINGTVENISDRVSENANPDSELYLLYHIGSLLQIDKELIAKNPKLNPRIYSTADGQEKYQKVLKLIKSISDNTVAQSVESIIKEFFYDKVLEAKLELLHNCLHYESAKESLDNIAWLTQEQQDIVKYFAEQTDNLTEDYINALTKLRISLLGS